MKRRNLIRGVATSSLLTLGAAGAAGQVADSPDGGPTHLKIRQDDGTYDVVPIDGGVGPNYPLPEPCDCDCFCCSDCDCVCAPCYVC